MNQQLTEGADPLWCRLVESNREFSQAFQAFCSADLDRVPSISRGLRCGGKEMPTALLVIPYLNLTERMRLYGDLIFLASAAHGAIEAIRSHILSLPRDWVLRTIELEAEPYLRDGTYDEYRRFLELYELLDRDLTLKLARRAAANPDPDIREAGEDFLAKLSGSKGHAGKH
jgi:hypothetical protein